MAVYVLFPVRHLPNLALTMRNFRKASFIGIIQQIAYIGNKSDFSLLLKFISTTKHRPLDLRQNFLKVWK